MVRASPHVALVAPPPFCPSSRLPAPCASVSDPLPSLSLSSLSLQVKKGEPTTLYSKGRILGYKR